MLRSADHFVLTASELGRKGLPDDEQLVFAVEKECAIVTHNRTDYEELAVDFFERGRMHFGIIISVFRPPRRIADGILNIADRFSADGLTNQILYI